jgi:tellurium resistance protein
MAIILEKGQRINLKKADNQNLEQFCVGANWGAIKIKKFLGTKTVDVDLDLSSALFDSRGNLCDHLYSPLYRHDLLARFGLAPGKLDTVDGACHHTGDDLTGDTDGDDGLDNEIITVDLRKISPNVEQIFFFLNNVGKEDFSQIPYSKIRIFEGTPSRVNSVFAEYDVSAQPAFAGKRALILGKLYKHNGEWKFHAIGDPTEDGFIGQTIARIAKNYVK